MHENIWEDPKSFAKYTGVHRLAPRAVRARWFLRAAPVRVLRLLAEVVQGDQEGERFSGICIFLFQSTLASRTSEKSAKHECDSA